MRTNRIKWMLPVLIIVGLMSIPAIVHAGPRWSRMDPVLEMNGHTINIFATWPAEHNCDILAPIKFRISAPGGEFKEDSKDTFKCEDGERVELSTKTKFSSRGKEGILRVAAQFRTSEDFPVGVLVYVDGDLKQECKGNSNKGVKCRPIDVK